MNMNMNEYEYVYHVVDDLVGDVVGDHQVQVVHFVDDLGAEALSHQGLDEVVRKLGLVITELSQVLERPAQKILNTQKYFENKQV